MTVDDQRTELIRQLEAEIARLPKWTPRNLWHLYIPATLFFCLAAVHYLFNSGPLSWVILGGIASIASLVTSFALIGASKPRYDQFPSIRKMRESGDPAYIRILLSSLNVTMNPTVVREASIAIGALLPAFGSDITCPPTRKEIVTLLSAVRRWTYNLAIFLQKDLETCARFFEAYFEAVVRFEETTHLSYLEKQTRLVGDNDYAKRVRIAAAEARDKLIVIKERQNRANLLLRPASPSRDTLLRPVDYEDEKVLLRPVGRESVE